MTTRQDALTRAKTVWPYRGVPYSQNTIHLPDGYRQDCSGFVCMTVGLPLDTPGSWGGLSTVTMVTSGLWSQLGAWDDLALGDGVMIGGPGTGGNDGHVMMFEAWLNDDDADSRAYIWEQAGGGNGPVRRLVDLSVAANQGYLPYAYTGFDDTSNPDVDPAPPSGAELRRAWPAYMPFDEWFGDYRGGNASHGGHYANERGDVAAIQQRCNDLGFSCGAVDGWFGPNTIAGVSAWQSALYASLTTYYGQVWADDWSRLFTY
jgi:hypothetical protein